MPGLFLGAGNIASKQNRHVLVLEGLVLHQEVIFKERPLRSLNSNSWSYIGIGLRTAGFREAGRGVWLGCPGTEGSRTFVPKGQLGRGDFQHSFDVAEVREEWDSVYEVELVNINSSFCTCLYYRGNFLCD